MQLTPSVKRSIDLSHEEATQLGIDYVGTEHMLLGLLREGKGPAGRVLANVGVDLEKTRAEAKILRD